jgi:hypothetical protein
LGVCAAAVISGLEELQFGGLLLGAKTTEKIGYIILIAGGEKMGLLYMISDTELTSGEVLKPEREVTESQKMASLSRSKKQSGRVEVSKKTFAQRLARLCLLLPHSIIIFAFVVLVYQGSFWFKYGWWKSVKARVLLYEVLPDSFVQWIRSGTSWSGVNNIISFVFNTPLFLFLLVFGFVVHVLIARFFGLLRRETVEQKLSWRG